MTACDQPGHDWTVILRRRPARMVEGQPQGGYTDVFKVICCYRGDHPYLDYREVSPELQQIRGPHPIAPGIAAGHGRRRASWHPRLHDRRTILRRPYPR